MAGIAARTASRQVWPRGPAVQVPAFPGSRACASRKAWAHPVEGRSSAGRPVVVAVRVNTSEAPSAAFTANGNRTWQPSPVPAVAAQSRSSAAAGARDADRPCQPCGARAVRPVYRLEWGGRNRFRPMPGPGTARPRRPAKTPRHRRLPGVGLASAGQISALTAGSSVRQYLGPALPRSFEGTGLVKTKGGKEPPEVALVSEGTPSAGGVMSVLIWRRSGTREPMAVRATAFTAGVLHWSPVEHPSAGD